MFKSYILLLAVNLFWMQCTYAGEVAVIGGGGAGVVSAYLIEGEHDVTLYEAESTLGGHVKSELVNMGTQSVAVDVGAEFINGTTYKNLMKLLEYLLIATTAFTASFNLFNMNRDDSIVLPLFSNNKFHFKSLFPSNLLKLVQLKWFIHKGTDILKTKNYSVTVGDFLDNIWLTNHFKQNFLLPFLAAQWGITLNQVKELSAFQALKYISEGEQSGNTLLEVSGGLHSYIQALEKQLKNTDIQCNTKIQSVQRDGSQYVVTDASGRAKRFDQVIFAVNPKIAGYLLKDLKDKATIRNYFQKVQTFPTVIGICKKTNKNERFLPKEDAQVVNVRYNGEHAGLVINKPWKSSGKDKQNLMKLWLTYDIRSRDDKEGPMPEEMVGRYEFEHVMMNPAYYRAYLAARAEEKTGSGLWFPGVHEDDSHEGTITAAIDTARQVSPNSTRLKIFD